MAKKRLAASDVQFAFIAPSTLFEALDHWRSKQIGPPSRAAAVRWILDQYLRQAGGYEVEAPKPTRKAASVRKG